MSSSSTIRTQLNLFNLSDDSQQFAIRQEENKTIITSKQLNFLSHLLKL